MTANTRSEKTQPNSILQPAETRVENHEVPTNSASFEAVDDPHRLARTLSEGRYSHDGLPILKHWRGSWHEWDGSRYVVVSDDELRVAITRHVKGEFDRALQSELATSP